MMDSEFEDAPDALDDPTALNWWWEHTGSRRRAPRITGVLGRLANRWGVLPRLVPHFALIAHRGDA